MQQKLFNLPVLKKCTTCKEVKPATKEFFNRYKDGFQFRCKSCKKKHYAKHKKEAKAYHKKWRAENHEKFNVCLKKYRDAHPEQCKARARKYQDAHREEIKARNKKWNTEHKKEAKAYAKKYREEHSEECKKYAAENMKRNLSKFANLFDLSKSDMRMAQTIWSAQVRKNKQCAICTQPAIHAHHILHASKYPELSLNLHNGIPLCRQHHAEAHLFDPYVNLIRKGWK